MPGPVLRCRRRRQARPRSAGRARQLPPALMLAAILLAAGCSPPPDAGGPHADLLAPVNAPVLLQERPVIGVGDAVFLDGWSVVERSREGPPLRWLGAEPGRLVIDLADPQPVPRRLELELRGVKLPDGGPLRVAALFDGEPLAGFACRPRWEWHRLEIPARLAGPGPHLLELRPARAGAAAAAGGRGRHISVALRELRLEPAPAVSEPPRLAAGALHLPPGTAAAWAFWVPPGGRLIARWEERRAAPFLVVGEGSALHPLGDGDLGELAGRCVRLLALNPPAADSAVTLAGLLLAERAAGHRPPAAPASSLLVVGRLGDGFPVTPSTTDPERALNTLLSGREAAALGWPLPPAFDLVAHDLAAVADFLATAASPMTAALVLDDGPARPPAEELADRFPALRVLMTDLPASGDDFSLLAATLEPSRAPENARDVDLTATVLAAAGRTVVGLDGVDLAPVLAGEAPARIRPVAPVWLTDRSLAVSGDRRWELAGGDPRPALALEEACALDYLRRRRRGLAWLER